LSPADERGLSKWLVPVVPPVQRKNEEKDRPLRKRGMGSTSLLSRKEGGEETLSS